MASTTVPYHDGRQEQRKEGRAESLVAILVLNLEHACQSTPEGASCAQTSLDRVAGPPTLHAPYACQHMYMQHGPTFVRQPRTPKTLQPAGCVWHPSIKGPFTLLSTCIPTLDCAVHGGSGDLPKAPAGAFGRRHQPDCTTSSRPRHGPEAAAMAHKLQVLQSQDTWGVRILYGGYCLKRPLSHSTVHVQVQTSSIQLQDKQLASSARQWRVNTNW